MNVVSRHLTEADMGDEPLSHRIADSSEPVEDHVYRRIMYQDLHKAIAQLPDTQRRRLLLYYFGGYTYEQIAQMEGCMPATIAIIMEQGFAETRMFGSSRWKNWCCGRLKKSSLMNPGFPESCRHIGNCVSRRKGRIKIRFAPSART